MQLSYLQQALKHYDAKRGLKRWLFGDSIAIKRLKVFVKRLAQEKLAQENKGNANLQLNNQGKQELAKILLTTETNSDQLAASIFNKLIVQLYVPTQKTTLLPEQSEILKTLYQANLLSLPQDDKSFNPGTEPLSFLQKQNKTQLAEYNLALQMLKKEQILTRENFEAIKGPTPREKARVLVIANQTKFFNFEGVREAVKNIKLLSFTSILLHQKYGKLLGYRFDRIFKRFKASTKPSTEQANINFEEDFKQSFIKTSAAGHINIPDSLLASLTASDKPNLLDKTQKHAEIETPKQRETPSSKEPGTSSVQTPEKVRLNTQKHTDQTNSTSDKQKKIEDLKGISTKLFKSGKLDKDDYGAIFDKQAFNKHLAMSFNWLEKDGLLNVKNKTRLKQHSNIKAINLCLYHQYKQRIPLTQDDFNNIVNHSEPPREPPMADALHGL